MSDYGLEILDSSGVDIFSSNDGSWLCLSQGVIPAGSAAGEIPFLYTSYPDFKELELFIGSYGTRDVEVNSRVPITGKYLQGVYITNPGTLAHDHYYVLLGR
jgi:hypothetical protein